MDIKSLTDIENFADIESPAEVESLIEVKCYSASLYILALSLVLVLGFKL